MGSFSYHVGQRIKKYRKSRGYTIEQFSAMINKSKATLSKYENGTITIDIETLYDIAQALNIDLKCFIDYQPPVFHQEQVLTGNFYFNTPQAYMYYFDGRIHQLVRSLLRFSPAVDGEGIDVILYMGVESFDDPDQCQHLFTGEMKPYDTITHMVLHNQINAAEKMYICMLNPMQTRTPAVGMLSGIGSSPFFAPVALKVLISKDHMMDASDADLLEKFDIHEVEIRTVLTCRAHSGVCAKCYGMNLATSKPVGPGEAVGIIAAQSIGEPGTQLTMRTFHTGGVAGGDITQGLPRVEELFEARRPKKMATLSEIAGKVRFEEATKGSLLNIIVTADDGDTRTYSMPHTGLQVRDGEVIEKGRQLQDGALNPHDVLRIRGASAVHNYLIQEVLKVYRQQGVDINDKHIEVIVRQMMRKVRVEDANDATGLLSGAMADVLEVEDENAKVRARIAAGEVNAETGEPLQEATYTQLLMGITKASLATDSFLSAASFQETTKVLTEAAIKGKVDHLVGLKENVIIGKLIPAGAGLNAYRHFAEELVPEEGAADSVSMEENMPAEEPADETEE